MEKRYAVTDEQQQVIKKLMSEVEYQLRQDGGSLLDPKCLAWVLQQLVDGKRLVLAEEVLIALAAKVAVLIVPDLSPSELVVQVKQRFAEAGMRFETVHRAFSTWNFYQYWTIKDELHRTVDVRGKRYEVAAWAPRKERVTIEEVRQYFKDLGRNQPFPVWSSETGRYHYYRGGPVSQDFAPFEGNTGAFLTWIMDHRFERKYVSIPSEDGLLWCDAQSKRLYAPYFHRRLENRGFYNTLVDSSNLDLMPVDGELDGQCEFLAFRELPSE